MVSNCLIFLGSFKTYFFRIVKNIFLEHYIKVSLSHLNVSMQVLLSGVCCTVYTIGCVFADCTLQVVN